MIAAAWVLLMASVVLLEVLAGRGAARVVPARTVAGRLWTSPLGRLALLALWAFVGIHLFCRYTLPH